MDHLVSVNPESGYPPPFTTSEGTLIPLEVTAVAPKALIPIYARLCNPMGARGNYCKTDSKSKVRWDLIKAPYYFNARYVQKCKQNYKHKIYKLNLYNV